ncbi:hypothetical protein KR067_003384 [Drosophila pandora]|nr:hypothetical protein KR067_003384 [Drosophila pandora]
MDLTLDIAVLFILSFVFLIIASFTLIVHLTMAATIPFAYVVVELAISITILLFVMYHAQTIHGNRFAEMRLNDFLLASLILFHDFLIIYWLTFFWQINYRLVTPDSWLATSSPSPNATNASRKYLDAYITDWTLETTDGYEERWDEQAPDSPPPTHKPKTVHKFWSVDKRKKHPGRHNNKNPDHRWGSGNDNGGRWDPEDMTPGTYATGVPFDDYPRRKPSSFRPTIAQKPDSKPPEKDVGIWFSGFRPKGGTTINPFFTQGYARERMSQNGNPITKYPQNKKYKNERYTYTLEGPSQSDSSDSFNSEIKPREPERSYESDKLKTLPPAEGPSQSDSYNPFDSELVKAANVTSLPLRTGLQKEIERSPNSYYYEQGNIENGYPPSEGLSESLMKNITRNSLINPDANVPMGDVEIIDPNEIALEGKVSSRKPSEDWSTDFPGLELQEDGHNQDIFQNREHLTTYHYPTGLPDYEKLVLNVSSNMLK